MNKSAETDTDKGSKADKNDKKLSVKKIKTLKHYFESLAEKPPDLEVQEVPVKKISAKDDKIDSNAEVVDTKKESVRVKINVFERMMHSNGDTPLKTPKKRIRRIGDRSLRKKFQ